MNTEFVNALEILAYLFVGTIGIAWLAGFVLKRMQPSKNPRPKTKTGRQTN